jgi:deoxyribonuclease IV
MARNLLLGGHMSISDGFGAVPEKAKKLTANCAQIFSKNQMQWKAKPIDLEEAAKFKENYAKFKLVETVIHDSYLINLATPDKKLLNVSREAFLEEVVRARHLGIRYLIFHPGSHMGSGEHVGLNRIADSMNWVRKEFGSGDVELLLENTAGQGNVLGRSFEQLSTIIRQLDDQKNVGVCFDTCHGYAAGYDVKTPDGFNRTLDMFEEVVGIEYLKAVHLNDSKGKQGSNLDRHEQIGEGFIGLEGFRNFMNDDRFSNIPMVLETPKGEKGYKQELKILRSLVK